MSKADSSDRSAKTPASNFKALTHAHNPRSASRAALLAAQHVGAVEARIWANKIQGKAIELRWSAESGKKIRSSVNGKDLEPLRQKAMTGNVITRTGSRDDRGLFWTCFPISGGDHVLGVLAIGTKNKPKPKDVGASLLAATLGCKLVHLTSNLDLKDELERSTEWFKTMDQQIRVLEGERQKFSALVNKTDAATFVANPKGEITWFNPTMARRYSEIRGADLADRKCNILCGNENTPCSDCPVRLVSKTGTVAHQERQEIRDRETRNIYLSAFPVRAPEGHVTEVLVMLQDITDLETLRRSEARYQLLFERSTDAIVMAKPDSLEIIMANRQAREMLGLNLADKDTPPGLLELHPDRFRSDMKDRYELLTLGRSLENLEVEVLDKDGTLRTCNACAIMFDLDGSDVILVEFRDVTNLRKLQRELSRADHLITLGTMNAGIAHEFKNRLAPLRAFAQLIGMQRASMDKILYHAPLMIQEIDRLSALVRDILDYARPQEPVLDAKDLGELTKEFAEEFISEFRSSLEENNVTCDLDLDKDCIVEVDVSQMRQAFLNLFKNSVEAMDNGKKGNTLKIGVSLHGNQVHLNIRDTGRGIDTPDLERIFDPFFSTKGTKGTGLGMCITRSLIEGNGGSIDVSSTLEMGSEVQLIFPRHIDTTVTRETGGGDLQKRNVA